LGGSDLSISRYEWFIYRWYNDNRESSKFKGNVFDALSLCLNQIRNTELE
jgi:tetratricopeptide (TPR) repeat protein